MGCGGSKLVADSDAKEKPLSSRETSRGTQNASDITKQTGKAKSDSTAQTEPKKEPKEEGQSSYVHISVGPTVTTCNIDEKERADQNEVQKIKEIRMLQDEVDDLKKDIEGRITEVIAKAEGIPEKDHTSHENVQPKFSADNSVLEREDAKLWQLEVEGAVMEDNSVVSLSQSQMDEMDLFRGDSVLLRGKHKRETICIALSDDSVAENKIAVNRCVRRNLHVKIGDIVSLQPCMDIEMGKMICVLPFEDTVRGFTGDLLEDVLKPYFLEAYRPVYKGDVFLVSGNSQDIEFKVMETDPAPCCVVAPGTEIYCEGEPVQRQERTLSPQNSDSEILLKEQNERITEIIDKKNRLLQDFQQEEDTDGMVRIEKFPNVSLEDIGGYEDVKKELMDQLVISQMTQEVPEKILMRPSYILLNGPPGCGKSMLTKAISREVEHCFVSAKLSAEKYRREPYNDDVRKIFDKAREIVPSILFLDLDELFAKAECNTALLTNYMVNYLLTELDGIYSQEQNQNMFVIGSVTSMQQVDPALLRPGRLCRLIHVPLPDEKTRVQILKTTLRDTAEAEAIDLEHVASCTGGFTGADLVELYKKTFKIATENQNNSSLPKISRDHWTTALQTTQKSLSDDEVEFYSNLNEKKDNFNFGFPSAPKEKEKYGGYQVGQFTKDDDHDDFYGNHQTAGHTTQNMFEEDDDDDLYS